MQNEWRNEKKCQHYVDANDNYLALDNEKHKEATNRSVRTATEQNLQCGCVFIFLVGCLCILWFNVNNTNRQSNGCIDVMYRRGRIG